ncbi:MAG: divalent-cation tolerance protein CutA [Bacteroidota bacterium]
MKHEIFIYITNPSREVARQMASLLLENQLIACANLHEIESLYRWEGKLEQENEVVLIAKTKTEYFSQIEALIKENHPYDVPCITQVPVKFNLPYGEWVESQLKK